MGLNTKEIKKILKGKKVVNLGRVLNWRGFAGLVTILVMLGLIGAEVFPLWQKSDISAQAQGQEPPEIVEFRGENSKTYDLGKDAEGRQKKALDISIGAIHYKDDYSDPSEQWKDIDLTWEGNRITKAPYILEKAGDKITVTDKKTGEVSTIELLDSKPAGLKTEIVPESTRVSFRHILPSDKIPFEAKFKVTGNIPLKARAFDDEGELELETTFIDGVLTEKLSQIKDKETGQIRPAKGNIRIDPTLDLQVGASADDIYVWVSNTSTAPHTFTGSNLTYGYIELGERSASRFGGGFRFLNVTIGNGDTIDVAYLTFTANGPRSGTVVRSDIYGEDADDAATYSTVANYNGRAKLVAVVWDSVGAWTNNVEYDTPSLVTPTQSIVNRAGWASGNAMGFKWEDGDSDDEANRAFHSFDGSSAKAPKLHIEYTEPNAAPTNDGAANITNMDDTDNLYAQKQWYNATSTCIDADGWSNINYCEFRLKQGADTRAAFRYTTSTNAFSIISGDTEWDLDTSGSSVSTTTNEIAISWGFKPQWDATQENDLEIETFVIDAAGDSATSTSQTNYVDVITNLVTTFSINDDRGDISQSITASGAITYSGSSLYPPDAEFTSVSVYDSTNNNEGTDSTVVNGAWSVTFTAPAAVGTDTYNLYINMADADYTDAEETPTDTFITDRIEVVSVAFDDSRIDVSGSAEVRYVLRYDYDDVAFDNTKGSITGFTWDSGNSWWDKAITGSASVATTNYDETDISLTDSTYGLTAIEDDAGANIITDKIQIENIGSIDDRIDISTEGTFFATATLEYDSHALGSGDSLTLDGHSFSWSAGNSRFELATTGSAVLAQTVDTFTSGNEATYGITAGNINSQTETVVWDRIQILTLSAVETPIYVDTQGTWYATAELEYDNHTLGSGDSFTLSSYAFSWDATDSRFEATDTKNSAQTVTINAFDSGSEATYSITTGNINSLSRAIIWQARPAASTGGGRSCVGPGTFSDSLVINQEQEYAKTREVELSLKADGAANMSICHDNRFIGCSLEPFWGNAITPQTKFWKLTEGDGVKTVYAVFSSGCGMNSLNISDTIILDTTPPEPPVLTYPLAHSLPVVETATPVFKGTAEPDSKVILSIVSPTTIYIYTTSTDSQGNWSYTLPESLPDGQYNLQLRSRDLAGNESEINAVDFLVEAEVPEEVEEVPVEEVPAEEEVPEPEGEEVVLEEETPAEEPVEEAITAEELRAKIAELLAQIEELQAQLTDDRQAEGIIGVPIDFVFKKNLRQGSFGSDVKYLQVILNSDPDTQVAASGVGSPGNETEYFGPLTNAAVMKFQEKYTEDVLAPWGLTKGTGLVGSTTRDKINEILGR